MKINNSNIWETKFSVIKEMPMKLKSYYKKQPIIVFSPYSFLIFLDTQLHEAKISEKTISEFFGNGVLLFSGEILITQRSSVHKR